MWAVWKVLLPAAVKVSLSVALKAACLELVRVDYLVALFGDKN